MPGPPGSRKTLKCYEGSLDWGAGERVGSDVMMKGDRQC